MRPAEFLAGSEAGVLNILKEDYTESQLVGVIIYPHQIREARARSCHRIQKQ